MKCNSFLFRAQVTIAALGNTHLRLFYTLVFDVFVWHPDFSECVFHCLVIPYTCAKLDQLGA